MSLDQMLSLGQCATGDEIEVAFRCKANETGRLEVTAAVLDSTVFQEGVRFLQQAPMEIQSMSSTSPDRHCGGHGVLPAVHLHPSNGNWHVAVDGVETEAVTVCGVMIGVRLAPGRHTVTFSYHNDALRQGITVSLVALAVFLGALRPNLSALEKGKFQRR